MAIVQFKTINLTLCDASGLSIEDITFNVDAILTMKRSTNDTYTLIETNAAGGKTYKVKNYIEDIIAMANAE